MSLVRKSSFLILNSILVTTMLIAMGGCAGKESPEERALRSKQRDSLVMSMAEANPQQALRFVDSLTTVQAESEERLAYHRALIYNEMGQKQRVEEWCKKALEDEDLQQESVEVFYNACDLLSTTLTYRDDNKGALKVAERGYEVARQDLTESGRHWMAVLLHDVGYCKMQEGLIDDAEQCFSQSYIVLTQLALADDKFFNLHSRARVTYNILDAYTSTGQFDKAKTWLEQADDAIALFVTSPECPEDERNDYQGGLAIQKAIVLLETGDRSGADASYEDAQNIGYKNSGLGILECATYLEKAERWNDLAELLPRIDSLSNEWGNPASLAHWKKYQTANGAESSSSETATM
jgi:tetratricopeptide (TPR) repeat protein